MTPSSSRAAEDRFVGLGRGLRLVLGSGSQAVAGRLGHRRLGVLPPAVRRPGGERAAHLGHLAHHVVERGVVGDLVHGGPHPQRGRERDRLDERVPQVHLAADRRGVPHQRDEREAVRRRGLQHHLERLEAVGVDQLLGQPAGVVGCERRQGALVDLPGLGAGPERRGGLPRAVEVVVGEVRRGVVRRLDRLDGGPGRLIHPCLPLRGARPVSVDTSAGVSGGRVAALV